VPGHTYENVYLIVVDAAGYSTVVRHNPRDHAARAFDLLRDRVIGRLTRVAAAFRCARSELWTWRGDGGILAIHDDNESTTRDVALTTARAILTQDLPELRTEVRQLALTGSLHLRIAVHKGTITYPRSAHTGDIHSPDLNFAAHLESTTPPDTIAISAPVHAAAGPHAPAFTPVGTFEDHPIYLLTPTGSPQEARRAWLSATGLTGSTLIHAHPQRPSQAEKARLVSCAQSDIVDLGTALRTSARYLTTTERPAHYRNAVLDFLARGGTYRYILLDPSCAATASLSEYRQENLADKIHSSIVEFGRFKRRQGELTEQLHVYQSRAFPGFATIAVDIDSPTPLILYSPYLMSMKPLDVHIERGDSPHYLTTTLSGPLFDDLTTLIRCVTSTDVMERVL
jgi:class 3 adenylate cyclase